MTTNRGGRPATGWVKWRKNAETKRPHWHVRLTLVGGERRWAPLDPAIAQDDEAGARAAGRLVSDEARASGLVPDTVRETVSEYAKRWLAAREGRLRSTRANKAHLETHLLPLLGAADMRSVERTAIERVVANLDTKVRKAELTAKSARNIWGTIGKMFDDATNAKPATGLRCLDVDPTDKVRGPDDDGVTKRLQFLYPSEFLRFAACEDVPRRWRQNAAIAIYLCLRDGEQRALRWANVDMEHGVVTVAETFDRETGEDREGTKTNAARMIHIPPTLMPLLALMRKRAGGKGHVCPLGSLRDMARGLRSRLLRAGVDRAELHRDTSVSKQIRWHDLRGTGATWLAVQGRPATEIRDVLGHTHTNMTDRYMRNAAMLRGGRFGEPFPPLPADLLMGEDGLGQVSDSASIGSAGALNLAGTERCGWDLNPRVPVLQTGA